MIAKRGRRRIAERYFDVEGCPGLDAVVARAASAIRELWDGRDESVAIIARITETQARVAFLARSNTIFQLRRAIRSRPAESGPILEHLASTLEGGTRRGVACLLLGFGAPGLVELELADGPREPQRLEEILPLFDACDASRAALSELNALRQLAYLGLGRRIPELETLAYVLSDQWDSAWMVAHAIRRAHAATQALGNGPLGARARRVLDSLDRATAERCGDRINAPGGSA